jgi:hypothetical protein
VVPTDPDAFHFQKPIGLDVREMQGRHTRHPPLRLLQVAVLYVFTRPIWDDNRIDRRPNLIFSHCTVEVPHHQALQHLSLDELIRPF